MRPVAGFEREGKDVRHAIREKFGGFADPARLRVGD